MRETRLSGSMRGCRKRAATRRACALLYKGRQPFAPPQHTGTRSAISAFAFEVTDFQSGLIPRAAKASIIPGQSFPEKPLIRRLNQSSASKFYTWGMLQSFKGGTDGGQPLAGVIMDKKGNLYGTTEFNAILLRVLRCANSGRELE
jgi:hypothetical protein